MLLNGDGLNVLIHSYTTFGVKVDPTQGHVAISVNKIFNAYSQSYLQEQHDMIRMLRLESEEGNEFLEIVLYTYAC